MQHPLPVGTHVAVIQRKQHDLTPDGHQRTWISVWTPLALSRKGRPLQVFERIDHFREDRTWYEYQICDTDDKGKPSEVHVMRDVEQKNVFSSDAEAAAEAMRRNMAELIAPVIKLSLKPGRLE